MRHTDGTRAFSVENVSVFYGLQCPGRDSNPAKHVSAGTSGDQRARNSRPSASEEDRHGPAPTDGGSKVVSAPRLAERDELADQLEAARLVWLRTGNEKALRRALLDVLRKLEESEHEGTT